MPLTHDSFLADVAAVSIGDSTKGAFGSGRLIAMENIAIVRLSHTLGTTPHMKAEAALRRSGRSHSSC